MKSLLWPPLTALLVFGCHGPRTRRRPRPRMSRQAGEVNLDDIAANVLTQAGTSREVRPAPVRLRDRRDEHLQARPAARARPAALSPSRR